MEHPDVRTIMVDLIGKSPGITAPSMRDQIYGPVDGSWDRHLQMARMYKVLKELIVDGKITSTARRPKRYTIAV